MAMGVGRTKECEKEEQRYLEDIQDSVLEQP